jgi:hypothetical protein
MSDFVAKAATAASRELDDVVQKMVRSGLTCETIVAVLVSQAIIAAAALGPNKDAATNKDTALQLVRDVTNSLLEMAAADVNYGVRPHPCEAGL